MRPGQRLEQLVKTIEEYIAPSGFEAKANVRHYDDSGKTLAEFDVVVSGNVKGNLYTWLIQCRDRPSDGPAPGEWIEQLYGRKYRFKFDRVTAVSTTGFAAGAIPFAEEAGIELRTVKEIDAEEITSWFNPGNVYVRQIGGYLHAAHVIPRNSADIETLRGFSFTLDQPVYRSEVTGEYISAIGMFGSVVTKNIDSWDFISSESPQSRQIHIVFEGLLYTIPTEYKAIEIAEIILHGDIFFRSESVPMQDVLQYQNVDGDQVISQSVHFRLSLLNLPLLLEFHKRMDTGESRVLFRKIDS